MSHPHHFTDLDRRQQLLEVMLAAGSHAVLLLSIWWDQGARNPHQLHFQLAGAEYYTNSTSSVITFVKI